jgi:hypothetical protein
MLPLKMLPECCPLSTGLKQFANSALARAEIGRRPMVRTPPPLPTRPDAVLRPGDRLWQRSFGVGGMVPRSRLHTMRRR